MKLITKEMRLKDYNSDIASKIAKEYNLDENEISFIRKGYSIEQGDIKFDADERSSIDYITTREVDRDKEIVEPDGIILTDYLKTPVVLYCHKYYDDLPIGRCQWIKADKKGLIAKTEYAKHQKAEDIWQYRKSGFPMAKSIGFVPLEVENLDPKKSNGACRRYPKSILLEYSDVPVASNPGAVQIAINKGILLEEEAKEMGYVVEDKIYSEAETKTVDQSGNISVFDLMMHIQKTAKMHHKNEMMSMMNQDNMRPSSTEYEDYTYIYIQDIFPHDYPNGSVIFGCEHRGSMEMFQYDCSYDDGVATLLNPKSVESTYVVKPEMKEFKEEMAKSWFPELITKPEVSENYIRMPIPDSGSHTDHKVRTITISKSKYIKGLYCIDEKKLFTLLFDKDHWTMATAKKWMKDHDMMKSIFDELAVSIVDLEDITKSIEEANSITTEIKSPPLIDEAIKELQADVENIKAGRVLSEKNRKLIKECVSTMGSGMEMLGKLLNATDKKDEKSIAPIPETKVVDDDLLEIEEEDLNQGFDIDEDVLKEVITASLRDAFKLDLSGVADESIRRSMGKVY